MGARRHPWLEIADDAPTDLLYLFEIFAELNQSRRMGFNSPEPIGFDQMYYWQQLNGVTLRKWERKLIGRLDAVWLMTQQKNYSGPKPDTDDGN